jgi:hypothetical protein
MVPTFEEQRGRASEATAWDYDPLIRILCGRSCTEGDARKIYDEIEANEPSSYYDPHTEFPFFGKRLMELQKLVNEQQPQTVRALLNDRRDVAAWYTIWNNQVGNSSSCKYTEIIANLPSGSHFLRNLYHFSHASISHISNLAGNTCKTTAAPRPFISPLTLHYFNIIFSS